MIGNRSLIEKADLALSDLTTDGGILVAEQARKFIRTLIDESVIMPMAAVVPMKNPTRLLEKIRFGSRVLRAGTEGQALGANDRAKPDLEKVELSAQLFKAEVRLNNEVLEDSIERQALRQTIMAILAERIALDMDEVIINGDITSLDPFLAKFDGILVQAATNVVAHGVAPVDKTLFKNMKKAMPNEFMRNKRLMRYLVSVDTETDYRDTYASRETGRGDAHLEGDLPLKYGGIPIMDVPLMPEDGGTGSNEAQALLTDPKNINVGILRKITIETDKDIAAGVLVIVATLRFDVKYAEERAVVKATQITVS
jgi:hypothetical protein